MFKNPGEKMKSLAIVMFFICVVATFILAFAVNSGLLSIVIMIGGLAVSFFSSLCLYGFGDCIEDISIIRNQIIYLKDEVEEIKSKLNEQ